MPDLDFIIDIENFNEGLSPLAHLDSSTFFGSKGQASEMKADVISRPEYLTQGPAQTSLTNGTQSGVVDQLIRFILDKPTAPTITYAIGTTKLFKLSSTALASGGSPSWPQTVSDMTEGESLIRLKANLYGFYNKEAGGDILRMPLSTEVVTAEWGSDNGTGNHLLEKDLHPVAAKEDIMVFGNGRYLGVYIQGSSSLNVRKLDFGEGSQVADVVFHSNVWWVAVNYGNGKRSQIYLYDGAALLTTLSDEAGVGDQKIGFLYVLNGIVYVAYDDSSSDGFSIGYLAGRQLKPLRYFSGTLPDHRQKALYKNVILFVSNNELWTFGSSVEQFPLQISKLCSGGLSIVGGIASPFGTPLIASSNGSSSHRLAKFVGYSVDSTWKSVLIDVTKARMLGSIHTMIVYTKPLGSGAKATINFEGNQGALTTEIPFVIETTNKTRHMFTSIDLPAVEDVRVLVSFSNGSIANDCPIRKIRLLGTNVEN